MFLRKKKTTSPAGRISPAQMIGKQIGTLQRKWAGWMHRRTRHWTRRQQKGFLFLLCLVIGGSSTSGLVAFFKQQEKGTPVNSVSIPAPLPLTPFMQPPPEPPDHYAVDTALFSRFRQHLDSLRQTPAGQRTYDSFLRARPGFLDSLAFAEKSATPLFPHQ